MVQVDEATYIVDLLRIHQVLNGLVQHHHFLRAVVLYTSQCGYEH